MNSALHRSRQALGYVVTFIVLTTMFVVSGHCEPISYTLVVSKPDFLPAGLGPSGTLVGSSGSLSFGGSHGDVTLTFSFQGDTENVVSFALPKASGFENLLGTATFQIDNAASGAVLAQGTFLPSAGIFVSVDNKNDGIGFGSFAVSNQAAAGFPGQPVYPYAVFEAVGASNYDLSSDFSLGPTTQSTQSYPNSGISCINFPFCMSNTPLLALPTSVGDLYISPAASDATGGYYEAVTFTAKLTSVSAPEPGTLCLLGAALMGLAFKRARRIST